MEVSRKLRVFISSTVRDLSDIRSALKFWLSELDFEVELSEFNDFDRRPERGTFDACFETIGTCDYFVLIVGERYGSLFQDDISVTRQEFRTAKSLFLEQRVRPALFIRSNVYQAMRLPDEAASRLLYGALAGEELARSVEQVGRIRSFIEEILGSIVPGQGVEPGGVLWLTPFSSFDDMATTLRVLLDARRSVRRRVLLANLAAEIEANVSRLAMNWKGLPFGNHFTFQSVRGSLHITADLAMQWIDLTLDQATKFVTFIVVDASASHLNRAALLYALRSGEFLMFDRASGSFRDGPELEAMKQLDSEIRNCQEILAWIQKPDNWAGVEDTLWRVRLREKTIQVPGLCLMFAISAFDRFENILRLSVALHRWALGGPYVRPELHPSAIDPVTEAQLESERPTRDQVRAWLANPAVADMLTGLNTHTQTDRVRALRDFPGWAELPTAFNDQFWASVPDLIDEYETRAKSEGMKGALAWLAEQIRCRMQKEIL